MLFFFKGKIIIKNKRCAAHGLNGTAPFSSRYFLLPCHCRLHQVVSLHICVCYSIKSGSLASHMCVLFHKISKMLLKLMKFCETMGRRHDGFPAVVRVHRLCAPPSPLRPTIAFAPHHRLCAPPSRFILPPLRPSMAVYITTFSLWWASLSYQAFSCIHIP